MHTLYTNATTPYGRIILLVAKLYQVDLELKSVAPFELPTELTKLNPFSQVPTLLLDNGDVITETPLILQAIVPQLYADNPEYNLPKLAKALGILFQGVRAISLTRLADGDSNSHPFITRSCQLLKNALPDLPALNADSPHWGDKILMAALAWIEFRLPEVYATLSDDNKQAVAEFSQTELMQKTSPQALEQLPSHISQL